MVVIIIIIIIIIIIMMMMMEIKNIFKDVCRLQGTWQICDGWSKQVSCRCRLQQLQKGRLRQRGHIAAAAAPVVL